MKFPTISTKDAFTEAFNNFKQSADFERLQNKFTPKPFYERNRQLRQTAFITSFLFNALSAVTGSACVFFFLNTMIQHVFVSALFTACFVIVIEAFKRLTLPDLFKRFLQFRQLSFAKIVFVLALTIFSAFLSFNGSHKLVSQYTPPPALISVDSIKTHYTDLISKNETKQAELKKTHVWKGKLTRSGQKTFQQIEDQNSKLQDAQLHDIQQAHTENKERLTRSANKTITTGSAFALISLVFDFLLCVCVWYCEYYDFRSLAEFATVHNGSDNGSHAERLNDNNSVETSSPADQTTDQQPFTDDRQTLQLAIKTAKANISAYKHKINNKIGNIETNQRGLQRWSDTLSGLISQKQTT